MHLFWRRALSSRPERKMLCVHSTESLNECHCEHAQFPLFNLPQSHEGYKPLSQERPGQVGMPQTPQVKNIFPSGWVKRINGSSKTASSQHLLYSFLSALCAQCAGTMQSW